MSNKTILQNCNNRLNTNNTDLDTILSKINNLPSTGETAEDLSTELTEQDTLITDQETTIEDVMLVLQNKAAGGGEVNLQEKTVTPTTSSQSVTPDSGYTGLSKVTINAVTSSIDSDIKAANIKSGVSILGVNGTLEEGITPTGALEISQNGTYDVTEYASANVNIPNNTEVIENIFSNDYSQIGYSGSYITSDGYTLTDVLWSDLTVYTGQSATWYVTNPIEIKSTTWYKYEGFSSGNNPGCCFLGEDKSTIYNGFVYKGKGEFCTPENAKYIVMTVAKANLETMVIKEMTEAEIKEMEIDALIERTLSGDYVNNRITTIGSEGLRSTQITGLHCENVTSVGGEAVRQCSYLTYVYLPKCTNLGGYSFGICPLLERVELGAMTNIRAYDFYNCTKLTTLIINNTTTVCSLANVSAFTGTGIASGTGYIYVPDALVNTYKTATNWSTYAAQIKGLSELEV